MKKCLLAGIFEFFVWKICNICFISESARTIRLLAFNSYVGLDFALIIYHLRNLKLVIRIGSQYMYVPNFILVCVKITVSLNSSKLIIFPNPKPKPDIREWASFYLSIASGNSFMASTRKSLT